MKATMMKVSDPIIFGHAVKAWLGPVWEAHGDAGSQPRAAPRTPVWVRSAGSHRHARQHADAIKAEIAALDRPSMYMVDSDKGITNLHVPSDVIIDASMPAVIRAGGKGWDEAGNKGDTNCVIPDRCYASVYDETVNFFKANGALDP